jgi:hypothetical protein
MTADVLPFIDAAASMLASEVRRDIRAGAGYAKILFNARGMNLICELRLSDRKMVAIIDAEIAAASRAK